MKLYEKNGDHRVTVLGETTRVLKSDVRIHLLGELDELNSHIGLVRSLTQDVALWQELLEIQKVLLTVKHSIEQPAGSRKQGVIQAQVTDLETKIGQYERQLTQAEGEILPGGCFYSAQMDIARSIARRCERRFTEVSASYPMDEQAGAYLNRLSDYLYIQARLSDAKQQGLTLTQQIAKQVEHSPQMGSADIQEIQPVVAVKSVGAVSDSADMSIATAPSEPIVEKIPALCKDRVANRVKKFSTKVNNSYGTFYTICIVDPEGELLATNSLARHSVQVHGSLSAAKEALHRARIQGEKAATVEKSAAALYENGYLIGAVGIYGSNEKANNEKTQLAVEMLQGALQR